MDDLGSFLEGEGQPEDFSDAETTYALINDDDALWAMRRLANSQRRINAKMRQAEQEIERIRAWVTHATKSDRETVDYFEGVLSAYMNRVRESEDRKSLTFPDGDVTSTATQDKVKVDNAELFLKWAESNGHPDWIRTKKEPDLAAIKSKAKYEGDSVIDAQTGEVVEGLSHVPASVSVKIKVIE
jgi:phage host-nuclease inhibitor protein Gam